MADNKGKDVCSVAINIILDTKQYSELCLSDPRFSGSHRDGGTDDDVLRFVKDYTIRALTTSKVGGVLSKSKRAFSVCQIVDVLTKTCLFKICVANE